MPEDAFILKENVAIRDNIYEWYCKHIQYLHYKGKHFLKYKKINIQPIIFRLGIIQVLLN